MSYKYVWTNHVTVREQKPAEEWTREAILIHFFLSSLKCRNQQSRYGRKEFIFSRLSFWLINLHASYFSSHKLKPPILPLFNMLMGSSITILNLFYWDYLVADEQKITCYTHDKLKWSKYVIFLFCSFMKYLFLLNLIVYFVLIVLLFSHTHSIYVCSNINLNSVVCATSTCINKHLSVWVCFNHLFMLISLLTDIRTVKVPCDAQNKSLCTWTEVTYKSVSNYLLKKKGDDPKFRTWVL